MTELDKNFEEVTNKALETGEQVVTFQCPCCFKTFYMTESEANYQYDDPTDQSPLKLKHIGRKCPFCGFAGGYDTGRQSKVELAREQTLAEIEAEQRAQDIADKNKTSWTVINNMGVDFKN